jgi:exodeoxyribonuclease V alpha subunit
MADNDIIEFRAKIEHIVYFNDSWGVIKISTDTMLPHSAIHENYDVETNKLTFDYATTLTGKMPSPEVGQTWDVKAHYFFNQKYKHQYVIDSVSFSQPKTVEDVKSYLESVLTIRQAETLLGVYPNIVEEVIAGTDNVDLSLLSGFGQFTWDRAKDKIIENFAISDILSLLIPLGISFSKIKTLLGGEPNPQILKEKLLANPYALSKIDGITFKTVDKIAIQLNPSLKKSESRLISFIDYFMEMVSNDSGHTWVRLADIRNGILNDVPEIEEYLDVFIAKETENSKMLHVDGEGDEMKIGLKKLYNAEKLIWEKLIQLDLSVSLNFTPEAIENGLESSQAKLGFSYSDEQMEIIKKIMTNNFSIITGKAGTGKTTIARGVLDICNEMGYSIALASLSAKAAIRSQEVTGYTATTIHRLLGAGKEKGAEFSFNEERKLPCDVLMIDESSMVNTHLFMSILKAVNTAKTKVIFVGDFKQLSPISAGNTFHDLITTDKYSFLINELTKIQRQAEDSAIIVDANKIREGLSPIGVKESRIVHGKNNDLYYVFKSDIESVFTTAISSYISSVKMKGVENVVILSPRRKKGVLNSSYEINREVQKQINESNKDVKFVHGDIEFWLNDRVIHTKNNYDKNIFNGEVGTVISVGAKEVLVQYTDKVIVYNHTDIKELDLAYCISVHKSQGSEYSDVIIVLDNSHFVLLSNQLLYTALTRAQKRCLIVAQPFAFDKALEEDKSKRQTWTEIGEFTDGLPF